MLQDSHEHYATALGMISIALGALGLEVLVGWKVDLPGASSIAPQMVSMKPITAATLLVCAAVVALLSVSASKIARHLVCVLAFVVAAVGAASLAQYAFGIDLVFDRWLFAAHLPAGPASGRMPPNSALCFLLLGTALLLVESRNLLIRRAADLAAAIAAVVALAAILGYLFEVTTLYQVATFNKMALHTAFGFLLVATTVFLVRPEFGIFAFLVGDDAGAVVARRLLPATMTVLLWVAGLLSIGARMELYSSRLVASLLVLAAMVVLTALIGHSARLLRRLDLARRAAENELRRNERWLATTLRSIGDAVIATDTTGHILLLNPMAEEITGWLQQEAAGQPVSEVFQIVDEGSGEPLEDPVTKVLRCGDMQPSVTNAALLTRDGRRIPIDDGAAPIRDSERRMIGVVLVFRDVTARRQAEEALRLSEKLAATGRLAASIAHEINNPLQAVTTILYLMQMHGGLDRLNREHLDAAQQELSRVSHITKHTLRFYHDPASSSRVRVSDLLDDVLALYRRRIDEQSIRVDKRFHHASDIEGFEGELRQTFSNLLVNALDAVDRNGQVVLHVVPGRDWKTGEEGVRVIVADNGRGIPPELLRRVFRPFFTTKGEGGTGLGLWVSAGIIDRHRGRIRVRSSTRPGRSGTCFVVWLPAAAASVTACSAD